MAFQLPQDRIGLRRIQLQKRNIPLEQILAVQGQTPITTGIETIGKTLGEALQRQNQMRMQGQQLAQLATSMGQPIPEEVSKTGMSSISPSDYTNFLLAKSTVEKNSTDRAMTLQQLKNEGMLQAALLRGQLGNENKENTQQDKLEKIHADRMTKVLSNRSGGLGLQDAKVNQAIDLRTLVNQTYDPQTKTYNIPPAMHSELVLGLARLLSPTGQIGIELEQELKQKTAREGLANAFTYITGTPIAGPTQDVAKMFIHTIDRQGETSERLRNQYITGLKKLRPAGLSEDRAKNVENAQLGSSFIDLLKNSPDQQQMKIQPFSSSGNTITIRASDGSIHSLPRINLDKARQRDPGLQVMP